MSTSSSNPKFLPQILSTLPPDLSSSLDLFCFSSSQQQQSKDTIECLLRFVCNADPPSSASAETKSLWPERQKLVNTRISELLNANGSGSGKRAREEDGELGKQVKRQKVPISNGTTSGDALFTLHAVSANAPVRKKVDITVTTESITFTNSSNNATEAVIPLSTLKRAFIVPTRGKSKPHWTVIFTSNDIPDTSKSANPNQQIIFGLDASAPSGFSTTSYSNGTPQKRTIPKGDATLPSLHELVMHTGIKLFEPSAEALKSACAGSGNSAAKKEEGIPGVEGYRATKPGTLWFFQDGLLWGESKPCEFWAVGDLLGRGVNDAIRTISATGRTCSVYITRRDPVEDGEEEEEEVGIETEISMVDAKEQDGIAKWVREHRHLFGKRKEEEEEGEEDKPALAGPTTIRQMAVDSDSEDESFEGSEDSEDGGSGESSSEEGGDGDGGEEDEAEESGLEEEDEEGGVENDDEAEELDPAHHPLLRPGAMPKNISKAAIDMVVGMVEDDMMGEPGTEADVEEEDELDD